MIGQLGGHELFGDPANPHLAVALRLPDGGALGVPGLGEQVLDGGGQRPRKPERSIHRRHVASRLDGGYQLAAHPGPARQFGLGESALETSLADR
ncbi:MAG TPA: hypothetical protein VIK04_17725 [Solirubrobacteraceae bacterium]